MSREQRPPWWAWGCGDAQTANDRRNLARFNLWALGWAALFGAASFAFRHALLTSRTAAACQVAVDVALGVATLSACRRFLRQANEMQRRIQLEGVALGFGAGIPFSPSYRLLERLGAPQLDITDPLMVFVIFWALGQWLAARRFR